MKKEALPKQGVKFLYIKTVQGVKYLLPEQIIYVGYVTDGNGKRFFEIAYIPHGTHKAVLERLSGQSITSLVIPKDCQLMQVHRNCIANLDFVEGHGKRYELLFSLRDLTREFRVGSTYLKAFLQALANRR